MSTVTAPSPIIGNITATRDSRWLEDDIKILLNVEAMGYDGLSTSDIEKKLLPRPSIDRIDYLATHRGLVPKDPSPDKTDGQNFLDCRNWILGDKGKQILAMWRDGKLTGAPKYDKNLEIKKAVRSGESQ